MRCEANSKSSGQRCKRYCAKGLRRCSRHRPRRDRAISRVTRILMEQYNEGLMAFYDERCPAFSLLR